jgi:hypothetical protein
MFLSLLPSGGGAPTPSAGSGIGSVSSNQNDWGDWKVFNNSSTNDLEFKYNDVVKFKLTTAGTILAADFDVET